MGPFCCFGAHLLLCFDTVGKKLDYELPGHGRRDDVAELDIDGRRCRASLPEKEKKKRVGMASREGSGVRSK
jgi:hypothetical protein